jgi:hypothetical protein
MRVPAARTTSLQGDSSVSMKARSAPGALGTGWALQQRLAQILVRQQLTH